ncbi:type IV pilin [Uliginosibacterium sp. TH139]|nr:type IV pilin [Uliginosibacterium sp. TH139]
MRAGVMRKKNGFTLIELMITVAVIGILAAIAYPSFIDYVRKTKFAHAKDGVMQIGAQLERLVAQASSYPSAQPALGNEYADVTFSYGRSDTNRDYSLGGAMTSWKVWVGINSKGTRCGCSGGSCEAPSSSSFGATTTSCPSGTSAF